MPGSSARSPSPGITGVRETRERQSSLLDEDHDREIEMKSAPVLDHHEPMKVDVAAGLARTSGGFWRGGGWSPQLRNSRYYRTCIAEGAFHDYKAATWLKWDRPE
jgi:hypothetical protein